MASSNEITQIKQIKSEMDSLDTTIQKVNSSYLSIVKNIESGNAKIKEAGISYGNLNKAQKQTQKTSQDLDRVGKQLAASEQKLKDLQDKRTKTIIANRSEVQKQTAEIKRQTIAQSALKGSYDKINASLNSNIARYKALSEAERNNTKVGGQLLKSIKAQDKALKDLDSQMGRSQRNVGNYRSAISGTAKSLIGAFGIVGGVAAFASVLKSSIATISNFEKTMSQVRAITGATSDEFNLLQKDALRLGASTKFTASEVGSLQVEFGKLGFSTKEILNATAATLDLAAATNSDLARSAEVAGSVVRAFGFDASQTREVVDVMARSFTSTALDIEKFATGMAIVAPVSKNAGVSLEKTTALLGVLADRGVDASTAGTSLRNIFLELSKQGLTFNEAMSMINNATDKNAVSLQLFGKRGSTAASIIAGLEQETAKLTGAFENSAGAAAEMAEIVQDNLAGDVTRAQSAWEGLILSLNGGSGAISGFFRGITNAAIGFVNNLTMANKTIAEIKQTVLETAQAEQQILDVKEFEDFVSKVGKEGEKLSDLATRFLNVDIARLQSETNEEQKRILTDRITNIRDYVTQQRQAEEAAALGSFNYEVSLSEKSADEIKKDEKAKGKAVLDRLKAQEDAIKATMKIEKDELDELFNFYEDEFEAEVEAYLDKEQKKRDAAKKTAEEEKEIASQTQDILFEVGATGLNALFDLKSAKSQQELELIQGNLEQGVISEEEAARQTAAVKQKQARADKLQSLFNIGISTAEAILKVTAQTGVLSPFVIPGIIALGAIQAAAVAATPIPEFAKGTNNTPDKFIAGEKGRELMTLKSGETMIVDSPTYFKGSQFKGAKIKSNAETERIIKSQDREQTSSLSFNDARIINELSGLRKDIKKKPVMIVDKNSNQIGYLYGRNKNRYLNKLING